MFDAFKKLRLASAFLGHTPEPGGSGSFSLRDVLGDLSADHLESFGGDLDAAFAEPGVGQLFENEYLPPPESIEVLLDLPRETLGYQYGIYLQHHRITIAPPPADYNPRDRIEYIRERVRMNHALLHVITEYDASTTGELALQAFFVGQLGNLASGTIIATGLIRILQTQPSAVGESLQVLAEAYERGRAARAFLGTPWEEFWTAPIAQVRELTGIPARTSSVALLDIDRLITEVATRGDAPAEPQAPEPTRSRSPRTLGFGGAPASRTRTREPEPEPEPPPPPEPEPAPYLEPRRPRRRWAGLDLLSQSSAEPEPAPPPEPEPEPAPAPARERPSRLRLDPEGTSTRSRSTPEPTPRRRADPEPARSRPGESDPGIEATETLFDPPSPPPPPPTPPSARSLFAPKDPSRSPHEAPTVDSRPLEIEATIPANPPPQAAASEPTEGRPRRDPGPKRRTKEEGGGYKEIESVDEDLPNPGDRDYF